MKTTYEEGRKRGKQETERLEGFSFASFARAVERSFLFSPAS